MRGGSLPRQICVIVAVANPIITARRERKREREKWRVTAGRRKQRACVKLVSTFSRQVLNSVTLLQVNRRGHK